MGSSPSTREARWSGWFTPQPGPPPLHHLHPIQGRPGGQAGLPLKLVLPLFTIFTLYKGGQVVRLVYPSTWSSPYSPSSPSTREARWSGWFTPQAGPPPLHHLHPLQGRPCGQAGLPLNLVLPLFTLFTLYKGGQVVRLDYPSTWSSPSSPSSPPTRKARWSGWITPQPGPPPLHPFHPLQGGNQVEG